MTQIQTETSRLISANCISLSHIHTHKSSHVELSHTYTHGLISFRRHTVSNVDCEVLLTLEFVCWKLKTGCQTGRDARPQCRSSCSHLNLWGSYYVKIEPVYVSECVCMWVGELT